MDMARSLGHVDGGQEEALEALCRAAQAELAGRLRPEVRSEDCEDAFILACAWLALAGLAAGGVLFLLLLTIGLLLFDGMSVEHGGLGLLSGSLCGGAAAGLLGARPKKKKRKR